MRYWLTTHWPPRRDEVKNYTPYGVWIPNDRQQNIVERFKAGDHIFVYQTKSGPDLIERYANGYMEQHKRDKGREGIIALLQATTPIKESGEPLTEYSNHPSLWWRYCAETFPINTNGFVGRGELNRILGYKSNYVFHGFGESSSGLKEISFEQYEEIRRLFVVSSAANTRKGMLQHRRSSVGAGGEGELHKALKNLIASAPSTVIGESGITLVEEEHHFCTGDRVDVLLRDSLGRYIVVEIEQVCEMDNYIGVAQCIKYRALQAFECNMNLSEVRAILFAKRIDKSVQRRCDDNKILWIEHVNTK